MLCSAAFLFCDPSKNLILLKNLGEHFCNVLVCSWIECKMRQRIKVEL